MSWSNSPTVAAQELAQKTFGIAELRDMIHMERDPEDLLAHYKSDKSVTKYIDGSPQLLRKLFFIQRPSAGANDDDWRNVPLEPNTILFPDSLDDPDMGETGYLRFAAFPGQLFQMDFSSRLDGWLDCDFALTVLKEIPDAKEYLSNKDATPIDLPDFYLDMFLADQKGPLTMQVSLIDEVAMAFSWMGSRYHGDPDFNELQAQHQVKTTQDLVWIPEEKTLRQVLDWATGWSLNRDRTGYGHVVDGFYQFVIANEGDKAYHWVDMVRMGKNRHVPLAIRDAALEEEAREAYSA